MKTNFLAQRWQIYNRYTAGGLVDGTAEFIREVSENPQIAGEVIEAVESRVGIARKKYIRLALICTSIYAVPFLIFNMMRLAHLPYGSFLSSHQILGPDVTNGVALLDLAATSFVTWYYPWRRQNGLGYVADHLSRALTCGLKYQADPTNIALRDEFALTIQKAATCYSAVFRYSSGRPRFFASHVRSMARGCRNNILSVIPTLVTAGYDEIGAINADLARLIIRSQTGFWHRTGDLVKGRPLLLRRDLIRVATYSFVKDRAIQVALIAATATLLAVAIPLVTHLFMKSNATSAQSR